MIGSTDAGLQIERTLLAWERTLVALAAGFALACRLGASVGPVVIAGAGIAAAIALVAGRRTVRRRLRLISQSFSEGRMNVDAVPLAALAAATSSLAVLAGVLVLARGW